MRASTENEDGVTNESGAERPAPTGAMISRRAACGILAGLAATPLPGFISSAFAAVRQEPNDIRYVLTDRRYPESLEFSVPFQRFGVGRLEITDGLTNLWRNVLVPLWSEKGGIIVGLTRRETWTCVAEQARSSGRKSILCGRHAFSDDGCVTDHYLSGSPAALADAAALETCGRAWPGVAADLAMGCPIGDRRTTSSGHFAGPDRAMQAVPSFFLVSWVIA